MNVHATLAKPVGWHENRLTGIGGSDANTIMSGDTERIYTLWLEKTGQREPDDLSNVLPVQLGSFTEPFNRYWYTLVTGRSVTDEGEQCKHETHDFMRCELDGRTTTEAGQPAIFEAKHVNPFKPVEEQAQKYMPQLHHNMACAGVHHAVVSFIRGNMDYQTYEVAMDEGYLLSLLDAEERFWRCVEGKTPPAGFQPVAAPVDQNKLLEVDMTGSNEWASNATTWLENKKAKTAFDKADKEIKSLIENNVGRAFGHGLEVNRDKRGSLRIKEMK